MAGLVPGHGGLGEALGEQDAAADGADDAFEGEAEGCDAVVGRGFGYSRGRFGLGGGDGGCGVAVELAREVGAELDELVQDLAVDEGVVGGGGISVGGHGWEKNIFL